MTRRTILTGGDLQDNSTLAHSGNWFAEIGNGVWEPERGLRAEGLEGKWDI